MKNDLIIITDKYPFGYGEATFVEPEIEYLKQTFNITILSKGSDQSQERKLPDGVHMVHCSSKITKKDLMQYGFLVLFQWNLYKELKVSLSKKNSIFQSMRILFPSLINAEKIKKHLKKIIKNTDANHILIYSFWFNYSVLAAVNVKKNCSKHIKVVTRVHGYDLYSERNPLGYQPFQDMVLPALSRVIFTCETGKEYYLTQHKEMFQNQFMCAYMGVPQKKCSKLNSQHPFTLVSCSNLIPLKRVDLIIDALEMLDHCEIQWFHLGDGILRNQLEALAYEKLSEKENITFEFWGLVDNQKIMELYASGKVNCFITASSTEGMPMSIIEVLSYGIPVIATNVGGIQEQIQKNGVLLDSNPTKENIANAIRYIYELSPEEQKSMGLNSYYLWKRLFDLDYNLATFKMELEKVLEE